MSNPPNPLANYRTYSYHQFLIVTDGVATATELSKRSDIFSFNRRPTTKDNARFAPRYLNEAENKLGYVVLIDGMKDVQFYIDSAKWETIIAPSGTTGGQKRADTIEVDGEMTIVEPFGLRFLEVLSNAARDLRCGPAGLVFVLKTVFVGHRDDGVEEMISNVRPFIFTMTNVTAVIDTGGATYSLEMVGVNNGTAKLPQISRIGDGINLEVKTSDTVATAMKKLETELNTRYAGFKQALKLQLDKAGSTVNLDKDFREVKYVIYVDPLYAAQEYTVGDNEIVSTSDTPGSTIIAAGANSTVDSAIRAVMNSSKRVAEDAADTEEKGEKFLYKITSTLIADPDGTDKYVVQYSVLRYKVVTQSVVEALQPADGEFIEFDYIFTGKNVDILEFDIKMDMGLTFFYTVAQADNLPKGQRDASGAGMNEPKKSAAGNTTPSADASATQTGNKPKAPLTPLFLGTTIKDPMVANKQDSLKAATFDALLSRHAAFENVECKMKIAGNPQLLDETNPQPDDKDGTTESSKTGTTGANRFFTTPALIKVNLNFPSDNELSGVQSFWYKGFYNLYSITQNFDGGAFTQDVSMFSIPQTDGTETALSVNPDTGATNTEGTNTPAPAGNNTLDQPVNTTQGAPGE